MVISSPFDKSSKTLFIDCKLFALLIENMIERKRLVFSEDDLRMTWGNVSTNSTRVNSLGGALWTNPKRTQQKDKN